MYAVIREPLTFLSTLDGDDEHFEVEGLASFDDGPDVLVRIVGSYARGVMWRRDLPVHVDHCGSAISCVLAETGQDVSAQISPEALAPLYQAIDAEAADYAKRWRDRAGPGLRQLFFKPAV